jgi:O-antigen ligase/polysaccharide polymerase Wzy-like membrane protein
MPALLPAFLLALFAGWCGTFFGGATAAGAAAAGGGLLATLLWLGAPGRDPLRLGRAGALLPPALWAVAAASAWTSPVARAGRVGVVLLPAFLWLPGVVARCWRRDIDRRRGLRGLAAATGGVALWALVDWTAAGAPRPAMPLGHHNLLAAWLVTLLPLALLPARERGRWRLLAAAAGLLAVAAVVASRSFLGGLALIVQAGLGLLVLVRGRTSAGERPRRRRPLLLPGLALAAVLALLLPRAARIVAGVDPSARARAVYAAAAWEGFLARPLLGWGPGAAAWTAPRFLRPLPGVNPAGEVVGELHSLPLQIAYELGAVGLLLALALAVVFCHKRLAALSRSDDRGLALAGLVGLAGAAVAALGSAATAVTALPLAAAVAAGAVLSTECEEASAKADRAVRAYALAAFAALVPSLLATWHYDRAVLAPTLEDAGRELAQAVRLDPSFPLYRLRLALLARESPHERQAASSLALRAAVDGDGVAASWLVAGILGYATGRPWAGAALARACALDRLAPLPAFYLLVADPGAPAAPAHGAHALLAEPRLAAATFWESHQDLFAATLEEVRRRPGVDAGWKEALVAAAPAPGERRGPLARLQLDLDAVPHLALSLHAFRRRPWPAAWPLVRLRQGPLARLRQPPATALASTTVSALGPCGSEPNSSPTRR